MKIYVYNIECGTCITTNKLTNNKVCEQIKVKDISAFKQSEIHISSYLYLANILTCKFLSCHKQPKFLCSNVINISKR